MKAISVWQPWAWLIVTGHKDIENRSWKTNYRGPLAIHAGLKREPTPLREIEKKYRVRIPEDELRAGGIIGVVTLVDVVIKHRSKWFRGPFGWVLADAKAIRFVRMVGNVGLMNVELEGFR